MVDPHPHNEPQVVFVVSMVPHPPKRPLQVVEVLPQLPSRLPHVTEVPTPHPPNRLPAHVLMVVPRPVQLPMSAVPHRENVAPQLHEQVDMV